MKYLCERKNKEFAAYCVQLVNIKKESSFKNKIMFIRSY